MNSQKHVSFEVQNKWNEYEIIICFTFHQVMKLVLVFLALVTDM